MRAILTKPLDWASIQLARLSVHGGNPPRDQLAEVAALLRHSDFFGDSVVAPRDLAFTNARDFRFSSPLPSASARNNVVHGRLYRFDRNRPRHLCRGWRARPTVILLHGWNMETGYRVLFPRLARRLNRAGVNAVMIELPYHGRRKPRREQRGAPNNFLSGDLVHVVQAARQAIADTRALVAWLQAQGCSRVGVWGISLGAWLGGVLACAEPGLHFAVMMMPVARMDRVIAELDFCQPLRRSLRGQPARLELMNLVTHHPRLAPGDILIVASEHDLFAPLETIEELWRAWDKPELWRLRHGHISMMMSAPVMERTVGWIAAKAAARG